MDVTEDFGYAQCVFVMILIQKLKTFRYKRGRTKRKERFRGQTLSHASEVSEIKPLKFVKKEQEFWHDNSRWCK